MQGLGTVINALAILAGGALGILCRSFLQERYQDTIIKATGFSEIKKLSMTNILGGQNRSVEGGNS